MLESNLKTFLLVLLISVLMLGYRFYCLSPINTFAIGSVVESSITKTSKKFSCRYRFMVSGKKYEGSYRGISKPSRFERDGLYLIAYDSLNPKFNYIFFDKPTNSYYKIDSLNRCCKPAQFIDFRDYFKGS